MWSLAEGDENRPFVGRYVSCARTELQRASRDRWAPRETHREVTHHDITGNSQGVHIMEGVQWRRLGVHQIT